MGAVAKPVKVVRPLLVTAYVPEGLLWESVPPVLSSKVVQKLPFASRENSPKEVSGTCGPLGEAIAVSSVMPFPLRIVLSTGMTVVCLVIVYRISGVVPVTVLVPMTMRSPSSM